MTAEFSAEDDARKMQALKEVEQFEGNGRVINERYSRSDYLHRRLGFLSKHPDYENVPKLIQGTTLDADTVFYLESSSALSVQEVRRRELKYEIAPLLPYPTSENMETLDNFGTYLDREWQPGDEKLPNIVFSSPTPPLTMAPSVLDDVSQATAMGAHLNNSASDNDAIATSTSTMGDFPAAEFVSDMSVDATNLAPQSQYFYDQAAYIVSGFPQQTSSSSAGPIPTYNFNHSTQHTAPSFLRMTNAMDAPQSAITPRANPPGPRDQATLAKIIEDLGQPLGSLTPADAPAAYRRHWTEASALASRAVAVPVKTPRGKKRAAPEDANDGAAPAATTRPFYGSSEPQQNANGNPGESTPPTKKPRLILKPPTPPKHGNTEAQQDTNAQPGDTTPPAKKPRLILKPPTPPRPADDASQTEAPLAQKKKSTSTAASTAKSGSKSNSSKSSGKSPQRKTSTSLSTATGSINVATSTSTSTSNDQQTLIERVARGEILPKSHAIAKQAADLRLQRLLADHASTGKKTHHPDFPPEFFDTANFSKADLAKETVVRCICGDKKDDRNPDRDRQWVGCDKDDCAVWQHVDCIGEACPANPEEDAYLCHVCDPFRHRRELQKIRKAAGGLP